MRPGPIDRLLAHRGLVVLDGGLATELERRGADLRDALWSARLLIDAPQMIRDVHLDYFRAGADVATTASYQASFDGFARRGIGAAQAADLMRRAVALACEARELYLAEAQAGRDGKADARPARSDGTGDAGPVRRDGTADAPAAPLVAASVGPYGATLHDGSEYRGDYGLSVDELVAFHRPRLAVLAAAGADLLACETLPCRDEAVALARLLPEFAPLTAWVAFSCRDGRHVSDGTPLAECIAALEGCAQVAAVGVNCTAPQHIASLVATAASCTAKPIVVYPNAGEHWDAKTMCWHGHGEPASLAAHAAEWHRLGARLIGGCCRTTPEDIRALRRWADETLPPTPDAGN